MTTWAYRDGILAADTQTTSGNIRAGTVAKIRRAGPFLIAISGALSLCEAWASWVCSGMDPEREPERVFGHGSGNESERAYGTIFLGGEAYVFFEPSGSHICYAPFTADGSGRELAIGAMEMGATAVEAVQVAAKHDIATGGPIQVYSMDKVMIPGLQHKFEDNYA